MIVLYLYLATLAMLAVTGTYRAMRATGMPQASPGLAAELGMTRGQATALLRLEHDARRHLCYSHIRKMEHALLCPGQPYRPGDLMTGHGDTWHGSSCWQVHADMFTELAACGTDCAPDWIGRTQHAAR